MAGQTALTRFLHRLKQALAGGTASMAEQAAALVWRPAGGARAEVLLITSRGTGRWILPKGWIEEGEDAAKAAAREAWEEAGVEGAVTAKPVGSYDYVKVDDSIVQPCRVMVCALALARLADDWPERAERDRKWMAPAEAARLVDEPELRALLEAFDTDWRKMAA